jgi:hypothetical protein
MAKIKKPGPYTDEERRDGIARLLAEAYVSYLKKKGRIKTDVAKENPLPSSRPDFLR